MKQIQGAKAETQTEQAIYWVTDVNISGFVTCLNLLKHWHSTVYALSVMPPGGKSGQLYSYVWKVPSQERRRLQSTGTTVTRINGVGTEKGVRENYARFHRSPLAAGESAAESQTSALG